MMFVLLQKYLLNMDLQYTPSQELEFREKVRPLEKKTLKLRVNHLRDRDCGHRHID